MLNVPVDFNNDPDILFSELITRYEKTRASENAELAATVPPVGAANSQSVAALVEIVTAELAYCGILSPLGFVDHITDKFNQRLNAEAALHT
jgi:hypothetical protein